MQILAAGEPGTRSVLKRLDAAWTGFEESYADLPGTELLVPGVTGEGRRCATPSRT